jgi:hypothetical protein
LDKLSILPASSCRVVLPHLTAPISNSKCLLSLDTFDDLSHLGIANLSEWVDWLRVRISMYLQCLETRRSILYLISEL